MVLQEIILLNQFYRKIKSAIMKNQLIPSLWFDNNALEAFEYYAEVFPNSTVYKNSPIVVEGAIMGIDFIGINGGPHFKPNNAISFMHVLEDRETIDRIWGRLSEGGTVLMALDSYPWSEYYGWITDKYGIGWQLYLGKLEDVNGQAVIPTLMFCGEQQGKCAKALAFYKNVFKNFEQQGARPYPDGEVKGQIMHAQFIANGLTLAAMDSGYPQDFTFNEAVSITITCKDQEEIDYYWNAFTKDGKESQCGWCKDPFGVSWQIVPENISKLLESTPSAGAALLKMKKIVIDELVNAN